ncbi:2'-5'-oligoadenylate synthase 1-like [Rhineura floridana]|uniref:2'-5'-oligoadenylate synthase 1-like n=1 Tax=Rhineura floridana TaxID=261503 RepID=UPI002AC7FB3B|nr:2'-5'-oligoadenylate synthase 1-like [Rhineura floridana]
MALYETEGRRLDKFIFDTLQPSEAFLGQVRSAIRVICEFLRENCFKDAPPPQIQVLKVIKGGSSKKGTALKGGSDADLVVFLDIFKGYEDQERDRKLIIQEMEKRLKECKEKKGIEVDIKPTSWSNLRVLSFKLRSRDFEESIEFDVLPAYNALGQYNGTKPSPQVYIDLIKSSNGRWGQFSPCFTELQRDFIIERPTKVKSLIRLVKHWYKEYVCPHKPELKKGESLPPQYALELLVVYSWEQGSHTTDFDMAEGFQTVLWLLQQYRDLCIFWTINYDFQNETLKRYLQDQLRHPRPVILDPADPTGIVGKGSRWDLLAKEAEYCSHQKCCKKFDGSPVAPWAVPVKPTLSEGWCTAL